MAISGYSVAKNIITGTAGFASRHPYMGGAAVGTLATGILGTVATYKAARSIAGEVGNSISSDYMTNLIMRAQSGPFGPSGMGIGIRSRNSNVAGITLAAHYAGNKNKYFGLMGLRYM